MGEVRPYTVSYTFCCAFLTIIQINIVSKEMEIKKVSFLTFEIKGEGCLTAMCGYLSVVSYSFKKISLVWRELYEKSL